MNVISILREALNKDVFDTQDTDMPIYNDMLKNREHWKKKGFQVEVVEMSPLQYNAALRKEGMNPHAVGVVKDRVVMKYMRGMESGKRFPMPVLEYGKYGFNQEGRHRVLAADKLGLKKIPVLVVRYLGGVDNAPS